MSEAGYDASLYFVPWQRCVQGVRNKRFDLLFSMWNSVPHHKKYFNFLKATKLEKTSLFVRQESKIQTFDINKLRNFKLGIHIGAGINNSWRENKNISIIELLDDQAKINMINDKRIDGFIAESDRIKYILSRSSKSNNIRELTPPLKIHRSSPAIL